MWAILPLEILWRNALAAIPLAVLVGALCRWLPTRPSTRHVLWLLVLLWLIVPAFLPTLGLLEPGLHASPDNAPTAPVIASRVAGVEIATVGSFSLTPSPASHEANPAELSPALASALTGATHVATRGPIPPEPMFDHRNYPQVASRRESRSPNQLARATGSGGRHRDAPDHDADELSKACHEVESITCEESGFPNDRPVDPATPHSSAGKRTIGSDASEVTRPGMTDSYAADRSGSARLERGRHDAATAEDDHENFASTLESGAPANSPAVVESDRATGTARLPHPIAAQREDPGSVRRWLAGLAVVRDALGRVPPIPANLWLLGSVLLLIVQAGRLWCFRRRLRAAVPAPAAISRMVEAGARQIGLRRPPRVDMTDDRISPLVCCWRSPRLILPTGLWAQLDWAGRQAVIYHELAHLRRRDHWVRWVEIVIGVIYWWNPLVWWVRGRLHHEAELSCDAWVTWLLPRDRRAFAQALLVTKQFVGQDRGSVPAVGIGVTTGRAGHFARRLTMVMTQQNKPRLSIAGVALVAALAMAGWVALPVRACDPKAEPVDASHVESGGDKPCAAPTECGTTFERNVAGRVDAGSERYVLAADPDDLEKRLDQLERKLARLSEQLDKMASRLGEHAEFRVPVPPMAPHEGTEWTVAGEDATVSRTYELPEGKLEALTALMVRPDVPILVSPRPGSLEVHATPQHQEVFATFVKMITPEATPELFAPKPGQDVRTRSFELPHGRLEALTALMARPDVPILVSPHENHLDVQGTLKQLEVFGRFAELIGSGESEKPRFAAPHAVPRAPAPPAAPRDGETVIRTYRLPKGKLETLTALMVRPDVPVRVSPGEDHLTVQATPEQHGDFERFLRMIDSEEVWQAYQLSPGKLEALTELMTRSDVPIVVQPAGDQLRVQGTGLEQAVFQAFVELIDSDRKHAEISRFPDGASLEQRIEREMKRRVRDVERKAEQIRKERKERSECKDCAKCKESAKCKGGSKHPGQHTEGHSCSPDMAMLDIPGVNLRKLMEEGIGEAMADLSTIFNAEQVAKLAEQVKASALPTSMKDWAHQGDSLNLQAVTLEQRARTFEQQAAELEAQADRIEEQAETIEQLADELTDQADALRAEADLLDADKRGAVLVQAESMGAQANELFAKAQALMAQAGGFESLADSLEKKVEAMDEWVESLQQAQQAAETHSAPAK